MQNLILQVHNHHFQKFGNPNLDPETTVAYELGLKTQFTPNDVLTVTAYYKDIFDYVSTRSVKITSSRFVSRKFYNLRKYRLCTITWY